MIFFISFLVGSVIGIRVARKNRGAILDQIQYAVAFGIAFTIICLFVEIVILRLGV